MRSRVRLQALILAIATSAAAFALSAPASAAAPARTCPTAALATVPCVIAAQNNETSPVLSSTPTRLVATTVAPGKYSIVASTVVFNSLGTGEPLPFAKCTLKAGSAVLDEVTAYTLDQATTVTLLGATTLTAPARLSVSCADPTGFGALTADYTRLQATQLAILRQPRAGTSKAVSCPGSIASTPCAIQLESNATTAVGASDTAVAALNLGAGSYTMIGRVSFAATASGTATVTCRSDNSVLGLSEGWAYVQQGKTATLTLDTSFTAGPSQTVEVTCSRLTGPQATVNHVTLRIFRVATIVHAPSTGKARCPVKPSTVPCVITAQGAGGLTNAHAVYAKADVAAGNYAVAAAVSVQDNDPGGAFHLVDCALVSGAGEFGAAFEVVSGQGATLFMIETHKTAATELSISCADDSNSGDLAVTGAIITATRVGSLLTSGS